MKTAKERIMDSLLAGQEICAADYARKHDISDTTVTSVLKDLGEALIKRAVTVKRKNRGFKQVFYSMRDRAAVESAKRHAASRKVPNQYTARGMDLVDLDFTGLQQAWGIGQAEARCKFCGMQLPAIKHRINTPADSIEFEAEMEIG